ncbi:MAG: hypothetical protein AB1631_17410 [Acidobacteriota bacterium]
MPDLSAHIDPVQVRAALDLSLTESDLPDATIQLPLFTGPAVAEVRRRDPQAESREGEELEHIKNALNLLVAAGLALSFPQITRQQSAEGDAYQRNVVSATDLAADLRQRADEELNEVIGADTTSTMPTFFGLATGRRGR